MATSIKEAFGTASQAITCSLAPGGVGLVQGGVRESVAIDNTTDLFQDAEVEIAVKLQAGTPAAQKSINVYIAISQDGTNFTDNATGADASLTLRSPTNLFGPFRIQTPTSGALTYRGVIPSVVAIIGGTHLPPKWSIIIENQTNITFDTTEGNHTKVYRGQFATTA
jgi:hypothetical protein